MGFLVSGKNMTDDKLWEKERQAVKATQIAFDIGVETQKQIKKFALDNSLTPSDQIRKILGLYVKSKPVRPRLTISLTEEDFEVLSKKYNLDSSDKVKIKEFAAQELIAFSKNLKGI